MHTVIIQFPFPHFPVKKIRKKNSNSFPTRINTSVFFGFYSLHPFVRFCYRYWRDYNKTGMSLKKIWAHPLLMCVVNPFAKYNKGEQHPSAENKPIVTEILT